MLKDLARRAARGRKSLIVKGLGYLFHLGKYNRMVVPRPDPLMIFLEFYNCLLFKKGFYIYFVTVVSCKSICI